jgi:hypothetical protein
MDYPKQLTVFRGLNPSLIFLQDAQRNQFSMQMVAPYLQQAGGYNVFPGLQESPLTGAYQEILNGSTGEWWISSDWCCKSVLSEFRILGTQC